MRKGQLRDYFVGVGVKRLSKVDAELASSNQHEVGTTLDMRRQFLGDSQRRIFPTKYVWLGESQDGFIIEDTATHYDCRERQSHRSPEWRLYFSSNLVTNSMRERDTLFLALTNEGILYFIVTQEGSTSEQQFYWLFDLAPSSQSFVSREVVSNESELDFAARLILEEIGIDFKDMDADRLDSIIDQFGDKFPKTAEFSALARYALPDVRAEDDPDFALLSWLDYEEALFKRLERKIVAIRINEGFCTQDGTTDVDGFIRFSLSVHNRRKSRMGQSLEHHLEAIFRAYEIDFVRSAVSDNNQRPDFLFPSEDAYRDAPRCGNSCLTMLAVKSSCKERWRQVLAEAMKISRKHLLTLEPSISDSQTTQMENSNLQLVVPRLIHDTYTSSQRAWLWSLGDFVQHVKARACKNR